MQGFQNVRCKAEHRQRYPRVRVFEIRTHSLKKFYAINRKSNWHEKGGRLQNGRIRRFGMVPEVLSETSQIETKLNNCHLDSNGGKSRSGYEVITLPEGSVTTRKPL